jgi:hypothetical protein
VGVFISVTMELCGVRSLAFAVGAYLPLSTTMPIFIGGVIRWLADRKNGVKEGAEDELGPGNLFSTGLVAGGALGGVFVAILTARMEDAMQKLSLEASLEGALGHGGFMLLGVAAFAVMGITLYVIGTRKDPTMALPIEPIEPKKS